MRGVHLTLRQAIRLHELASAAGDSDLCNVADRVIGPKTCEVCGCVTESVASILGRQRHTNGSPRVCRSCTKDFYR